MIENLIHTNSKENKLSQYGSLQAGNSKNENSFEGQFRALLKSFNSEPEISEDSQTDQGPLNQTDETETKMDGSSDVVKGSGVGSVAVNNVEKNGLINQNRVDQKSENDHENSNPAKITVTDASIDEIENSRNKPERVSTEMNVAKVSESDDPEVPGNSNSESNNEPAKIQELSKMNTESETDGENNLSERAQFPDKSNSVNNRSHSENLANDRSYSENSASDRSRSENSANDQNHREVTSEIKESLSDFVLKMERSNSEKTETENKIDTNDSRFTSKIHYQNETESSEEPVSFGSDNPDRASNVENTRTKQVPSEGHNEKREPEVLKSESNELRRFINVEEDSKTIHKSGEEKGTALQSDGSTNQVVNNPIETKEPVSQSDEKVQVKVKENSSSADLRNSEVNPEKSQYGESGSEKVQPNVRDSNRDYTFTTFNNSAMLNHEDKQNHSETRQLTESADNLSDKFINENIDKPIRIVQKTVESTVLIQDKVQPKRERIEELFLNNNESKESSRLTIPGIGADATKHSTSFSSGLYSEDNDGLSESEKNKELWKEHTAESDESDELNRSDLSVAALSKLADSTLSNHFLRRVLLPGLTQTVFTALSQSNRAENWQRHNFILEDGSKVQLSARKIDGVLQIKLGASIGELSKLLQIHQDEIREHLEKECNIKIDLQFEQGSGDQDQSSLENFFGESTKKPVFEGGNEAGSQAKRNVKKQLHTVVTRNFGYNSNEWTA